MARSGRNGPRDEALGMADGARLDFDTMAKMSIVELDKDHVIDRQCSSFFVHNENERVLGHNEDGGDNDDIFLLKATYPSGTKICSFCYYGTLVGFSANINSHGLIMVCNSLNASDKRVGEPKRIIARRLIESHSIDEVLEILKTSERAQGQHFFFIQNDRVIDVEASAKNFHVKEFTENFYHCNNFQWDEMLKYEAGDQGNKNYCRTSEGEKHYSSLRDANDIKRALSSHINDPYCFCSHGSVNEEGNLTLGSIFFDLNRKTIEVGYDVTCIAKYQTIDPGFSW